MSIRFGLPSLEFEGGEVLNEGAYSILLEWGFFVAAFFLRVVGFAGAEEHFCDGLARVRRFLRQLDRKLVAVSKIIFIAQKFTLVHQQLVDAGLVRLARLECKQMRVRQAHQDHDRFT